MDRIFQSRDAFYKTPFGAIKTGEACNIKISVPCEMQCQTPYMLLSKDGEQPSLLAMHKSHTQDSRDIFALELRLEKAGLYFYYFDLYLDYQKVFCRNGKAYVSREHGVSWQLTVYDKEFTTPEWLHGGIMYQIFPDRFYEGAKNSSLAFDGRVYRADKENEPYFWPNEQHEGYLNMDYFGGDFKGIQEKLPYLEELGITCIYLNPIFEAHSNHRYNTADYMKPDPALGTAEEFKTLCDKARQSGISIILDGVFSHTGSDSVYFNREGRYQSLGAYQNEHSPYRNWYIFDKQYSHGYRSWWGFETLPEVNEENEAYRNFICGENGVIDYWLSLGAAGFRLDVADELPDNFIKLLRKAVKRKGEDKLLIGEVWEDASTKESYGQRREYLLGSELDSVMNYPFRTSVIDFMHSGDSTALVESVMRICENYPLPALCCAMNFLSTHDTERGITALAGEPANGRDRYWQSGRRLSAEKYEIGKLLVRLAYVMLFTLPGVPCVYYGDEVFMQGYKDPFNRAYFNWSSSEELLKDSIKELSALRKSCEAFKSGALEICEASGGFLHYKRKSEASEAHVVVNRTNKTEHRAVCGSIREINAYNYIIICEDVN